jgi:hexulose-6-phosphate isomerase
MQVGVSQLVVPGVPVLDFAQQAATAGYEVVELAMRAESDVSLQTPIDELRQKAEQIRALGLEPVSLTHTQCTGNLLDSGQARQTSIDETILGLQAAKAMGIACTLHTLGRPNADLYYDKAYENGVDSLKEIAKTAESLGITLAVEQIWNGFLFSPLEMRRFLDEVGSDRIGFYFDPGNMAVFQFPHHWVKITGPHLKMMHLKDWKGSALKGGWTPLLEGTVDYAAMNRELRAIGYDGPMISEVELSDASLADTAVAIRKIIEM